MESKRDKLVDILKGIGIVSVVIGHSGVLLPGLEKIPTAQFVYLYHLMLFFFTSGMVFHPEKYNDPSTYIGKQIKSSYPLYVIYNVVFLLLHNVIADVQLLDIEKYSLNNFVICGSSILILQHLETIVGALWFVPMFLISKALFAVGFYAAEKCRFRYVGHATVILLTAFLGVYTNAYGMYLNSHLQTSLLGIPVIYLGYVFSKYKDRITKHANIVTCVVCAILMVVVLNKKGGIELSANQIIGPLWFYPVTILGMVFCVCLAKVISHSQKCTKAFSYLGSISFHIMALHFVAFKVFDWVYGLLSRTDLQAMAKFPYALNNIGLVYSVVGICIPAVLVWLVQKKKKGKSSVLAN